jgi:hypothetical protein
MSIELTKDPFDFVKYPDKMSALIKANELLHLNKSRTSKLVFMYSAPKVGSTSIVSSLRLFGSDKLSIIHIHDEEMLKVLKQIENITINELILYNAYLKKEVYVINVYRSPIERKISAFFEKIGAYHFNNSDQKVNTYNVSKVICRFNNIFPHIALGDHFLDKYCVECPSAFDYLNKYLLVKQHNITYIALRLKDSSSWGSILTTIFGFPICIVKDYESTNKPIKDLYKQFKANYRIPKNLLEMIMDCKYLKYYYSQEELREYINEWLNKSTTSVKTYSQEEYKLYETITLENAHLDYVQQDHYLDEGCICKACVIKRASVAKKLLSGISVDERVVHIGAKTELIEKRLEQANKINMSMPKKIRGSKDFKRTMASIVKGGVR